LGKKTLFVGGNNFLFKQTMGACCGVPAYVLQPTQQNLSAQKRLAILTHGMAFSLEDALHYQKLFEHLADLRFKRPNGKHGLGRAYFLRICLEALRMIHEWPNPNRFLNKEWCRNVVRALSELELQHEPPWIPLQILYEISELKSQETLQFLKPSEFAAACGASTLLWVMIQEDARFKVRPQDITQQLEIIQTTILGNRQVQILSESVKTLKIMLNRFQGKTCDLPLQEMMVTALYAVIHDSHRPSQVLDVICAFDGHGSTNFNLNWRWEAYACIDEKARRQQETWWNDYIQNARIYRRDLRTYLNSNESLCPVVDDVILPLLFAFALPEL
jgi:hypothetical protein